MVWIYGGGYAVGSKNGYLGTTLAVKGDVIVVTINYRLAMLGFLYDGPGKRVSSLTKTMIIILSYSLHKPIVISVYHKFQVITIF